MTHSKGPWIRLKSKTLLFSLVAYDQLLTREQPISTFYNLCQTQIYFINLCIMELYRWQLLGHKSNGSFNSNATWGCMVG